MESVATSNKVHTNYPIRPGRVILPAAATHNARLRVIRQVAVI